MSNESEVFHQEEEQVKEANQDEVRQQKSRSKSNMPNSIINSVGPDLSIPMSHSGEEMTGYHHHQHQNVYEHNHSMMPADDNYVQGMGDHSWQPNHQQMTGNAYCQHCGYQYQPAVMPQYCYPNYYYGHHSHGYRY